MDIAQIVILFLAVIGAMTVGGFVAGKFFNRSEKKRLKKAKELEPINAKDFLAPEAEAPKDQQWRR